MRAGDATALADYRRRVHESYAQVRRGVKDTATWERWREQRDLLFKTHVSSALDHGDRREFSGLSYFSHNPAYRFEANLEALDAPPLKLSHSGEGTTTFVPVATISLAAIGIEETLTVYWLDTYGGGLFLPFRDTTNSDTTYRGGRYLLDSAKGADLGSSDGRIVIDFNYSYHPSCVYSPRWSCPLAPVENRLQTAIPAGERLAPDPH
jgi:uncharacterized protein (DUF1684 family)